MGHDLQIVQPHAVAGFQLPGGNALQGAPHGLRHIGALVDAEDQHRRGEGRQGDAHAGQTVEDQIELHQQGRAPDHPDVEAADLLQHRHLGILDQRHDHRDEQCQQKREGGQGDGYLHRLLKQLGKCICQDAPESIVHSVNTP